MALANMTEFGAKMTNLVLVVLLLVPAKTHTCVRRAFKNPLRCFHLLPFNVDNVVCTNCFASTVFFIIIIYFIQSSIYSF